MYKRFLILTGLMFIGILAYGAIHITDAFGFAILPLGNGQTINGNYIAIDTVVPAVSVGLIFNIGWFNLTSNAGGVILTNWSNNWASNYITFGAGLNTDTFAVDAIGGLSNIEMGYNTNGYIPIIGLSVQQFREDNYVNMQMFMPVFWNGIKNTKIGIPSFIFSIGEVI